MTLGDLRAQIENLPATPARARLLAVIDVAEAAEQLAGTTHGNLRGQPYIERRHLYNELRHELGRMAQTP
jgi:hypothetical protein